MRPIGRRRDILFGRYGSSEPKLEYRRIIAELATGPAAVPALIAKAGGSHDLTIAEVPLAFMQHAVAL